MLIQNTKNTRSKYWNKVNIIVLKMTTHQIPNKEEWIKKFKFHQIILPSVFYDKKVNFNSIINFFLNFFV